MSQKVEGTVLLDGLIEGRADDMASVEPKLREWRTFVEKAGLKFALEVEGNSFSLLAANDPVSVAKLAGDPGRVVADALNQLMNALPAEERRGVFSTVRSVEYRRGEEIQTIYAVTGDGTVRANERTVEAQTVAPEPPAGWRERLMLGAVGLAAAVIVLWLSSLFVDYGGMWRRFANTVHPPDVKTLKVEAKAFERWFTVAKTEASQHGAAVTVTLRRTADFPHADADAERVAKEAGDSVVARLAVESVIRGRVCVWLYDADGKTIAFAETPIAALRDKETCDIEIPFPSDRRVARIAFTY